MRSPTYVDPNEFRFATRHAMWQLRTRGQLSGRNQRFMRAVMRNPIKDTPDGQINLFDMYQRRVEGTILRRAASTGNVAVFDWFALIAILLEMLPQLIEWIKKLIDEIDFLKSEETLLMAQEEDEGMDDDGLFDSDPVPVKKMMKKGKKKR